MQSLNQLVIRVSQSGWLFIFSAIFAFGSLGFVFFNINDVFEVMVSAQMFDFQNDLTVEMIYKQLPNYSYAARKLYYAFLFVDFFFPFFAGLVLAAVAAFALRHFSTAWYEAVDSRNLFAVMFIGTFFDWFENIFALIVVTRYPEELTFVATMLVLAKTGKLASIVVMQGLTAILLVLAVLKWVGDKIAGSKDG
jgi:hypothetical protein